MELLFSPQYPFHCDRLAELNLHRRRSFEGKANGTGVFPCQPRLWTRLHHKGGIEFASAEDALLKPNGLACDLMGSRLAGGIYSKDIQDRPDFEANNAQPDPEPLVAQQNGEDDFFGDAKNRRGNGQHRDERLLEITESRNGQRTEPSRRPAQAFPEQDYLTCHEGREPFGKELHEDALEMIFQRRARRSCAGSAQQDESEDQHAYFKDGSADK